MSGVSREQLARAADADRRAPRALSRRMTLLHGGELNIGPRRRRRLRRRASAARSTGAWPASTPTSSSTATQQTRRILPRWRTRPCTPSRTSPGGRIGRRPGSSSTSTRCSRRRRETGTALEINAALRRLDASSDVLLRARGLDVTFVHQHRHPPHARARAHGVGRRCTRRAAGSIPSRIANLWPRERFLGWLQAAPGLTTASATFASSCSRPPTAPGKRARLLQQPEPSHDLGAAAREGDGGRAARRGVRLREQPLLPRQARLRAGLRPAAARRARRPRDHALRRARAARSAAARRRPAALRRVPVDVAERALPRAASVATLEALAPGWAEAEVVLLGSIASPKYVELLTAVLGDRVSFPSDFVGRGDMSRGGLMLRCVDEGRELRVRPARGRRAPRAAAGAPASRPKAERPEVG